MATSVYPSLFFLVSAGLLFFYEINKRMETQIETDLRQRRVAA
jgi:Na+/melibiose symporter-like transporter